MIGSTLINKPTLCSYLFVSLYASSIFLDSLQFYGNGKKCESDREPSVGMETWKVVKIMSRGARGKFFPLIRLWTKGIISTQRDENCSSTWYGQCYSNYFQVQFNWCRANSTELQRHSICGCRSIVYLEALWTATSRAYPHTYIQ